MVDRREDIAWAAGLFEGEGCFSLLGTRQTNGLKRWYPRAHLTSTDEDVVRRFHCIVGVGHVAPEGRRPRRKQQWRWTVNERADFDRFAELIRPFLGKRRAARLVEVIELASERVYRDRARVDELAERRG